MNIFREHKEKLNWTFGDVGKNMIPPVNRGTAFKYINDPGKWSKKVIKRLAKILGIPLDKALKEWTPLRKAHFDKQTERKMRL
ncbi:MAG: hypothetical protein PF693_09965 [Spirochaetia bacterium]|nr:hypothetical protein [Spirochaetia bacterium]